jgi:hypothetical protein
MKRFKGRAHSRSATAGLLMAAVLPHFPASVAAAQEPAPADTLPAERPFVPGGQFDKPYLANLLGLVAIGGYVEAHARYVRADGVTEEFGFEAKRFNLFASSQVSDFVRFGAELEIEEGGEEVRLEFATVDLTIHPTLSFRAGMILSPLGRFNLSHDSPLNEFTDRPLASTELVGVALSEPGIGVFGRVPLGSGAGRLTYELYAVNGFHSGVIESSPDGTRIPEGRGGNEDANRSPAFVGRLAASPALGWELGLSAHHGAWNEFEADGLDLDARRNLTIGVLDFEGEPFGFRVRGELALAALDLPPGIEGLYQSNQRGFFAEVLREFGRGWVSTMPESAFLVRARLEAVDFDADRPGDSVRQLTLGLNFRPTAETAVKLDYVRGRSFDGFENRGDHAALLLSVATYF